MCLNYLKLSSDNFNIFQKILSSATQHIWSQFDSGRWAFFASHHPWRISTTGAATPKVQPKQLHEPWLWRGRKAGRFPRCLWALQNCGWLLVSFIFSKCFWKTCFFFVSILACNLGWWWWVFFDSRNDPWGHSCQGVKSSGGDLGPTDLPWMSWTRAQCPKRCGSPIRFLDPTGVFKVERLESLNGSEWPWHAIHANPQDEEMHPVISLTLLQF